MLLPHASTARLASTPPLRARKRTLNVKSVKPASINPILVNKDASHAAQELTRTESALCVVRIVKLENMSTPATPPRA